MSRLTMRPVGDAGAVTTERMVRLLFRQQGHELFPDGLGDVWWERGHEYPPSSGSLENSPDDGASVPVSHFSALPIGASS